MNFKIQVNQNVLTRDNFNFSNKFRVVCKEND